MSIIFTAAVFGFLSLLLSYYSGFAFIWVFALMFSFITFLLSLRLKRVSQKDFIKKTVARAVLFTAIFSASFSVYRHFFQDRSVDFGKINIQKNSDLLREYINEKMQQAQENRRMVEQAVKENQ